MPLAKAEVTIDYGEFRNDPLAAIWIPQDGKRYMPSEYLTDENGEFQINGLSADWVYHANVSQEREDGVTYIIGDAFRDLRIQPGEKVQLGVIDPEALGERRRAEQRRAEQTNSLPDE